MNLAGVLCGTDERALDGHAADVRAAGDFGGLQRASLHIASNENRADSGFAGNRSGAERALPADERAADENRADVFAGENLAAIAAGRPAVHRSQASGDINHVDAAAAGKVRAEHGAADGDAADFAAAGDEAGGNVAAKSEAAANDVAANFHRADAMVGFDFSRGLTEQRAADFDRADCAVRAADAKID